MKTANESGFTVAEQVVALFISSILLLALTQEYAVGLKFYRDQTKKMAANLRAEAVLQTIANDLRILGNGVPYDQANFQMGEDTLADPTVTYPIDIAASTATNIVFKLNEKGDVELLSQNFNPLVDSVFYLTGLANLAVGDMFYIHNGVVGEEDGLFGTIGALDPDTNEVTIDSIDYSPDATFNKGSAFEMVRNITYTSPASTDPGGVTRDNGGGAILLAPNSWFEADYLEFDDTAIALPLTELSVINDLRKMRVTVTIEADGTLTDGSTYLAEQQLTVALRNLQLLL